MADYLQRLNNVLEGDTAAAPAEPAAAYPRPRHRQLEPGEIRIGLLEFFDLDRCGLQRLVGERNSGLGRVMPPSRRLAYEMDFLRLAAACRDSSAGADAEWDAIIAQKERDLPLVWWNATFGSEEFAELFTGATAPLPLETTGNAAALEALHYLSGLHHDLRSAAPAVEVFEKHLQQLQTQAYGDRLLRSAALLSRYLNAAADALEERQARRPVCLNGTPTPRARALQTVFGKFYVGGIQPYLAQVHRGGDRFLGALDRLYTAQQAPVPQTYAAFYRTQLAPNAPEGTWSRFEAAIQRHTSAWQTVLSHCGMSPGL